MNFLRSLAIAVAFYFCVIAAEKNDLDAVLAWLTLLGIVLSLRGGAKGAR